MKLNRDVIEGLSNRERYGHHVRFIPAPELGDEDAPFRYEVWFEDEVASEMILKTFDELEAAQACYLLRLAYQRGVNAGVEQHAKAMQVDMTFEEFQATRVFQTGHEFIDTIRDCRWDDCVEQTSGYVYLGCLFIESTELWKNKCGHDGQPLKKYMMMVDRDDWYSDDLEELERDLYKWAIGEGYTMADYKSRLAAAEAEKKEAGSESAQ